METAGRNWWVGSYLNARVVVMMYAVEMTNRHAQALGRRGGKARAAKLTAEERSAIAKKASDAAKVARAKLTPEERSEQGRRAVAARWAKRDNKG